MLRLLTFLDEASGTELTLPVTPPSYEWTHSNQVETVQLDQVGEINLAGAATMGSASITVLLPMQLYPFCAPGAIANPQHYLDRLTAWSDAGTVVRFIVSGTRVNYPVLIESVAIMEKDGTNDIHTQISIREWRKSEVAVLGISGGGADPARDASTGASTQRTYITVEGDTLWSITQRFYGDGGIYKRLAAANSEIIYNPNIIWPGMVLSIPPIDELPAAQEDSLSVYIADQTTQTWDSKIKMFFTAITDAGKKAINKVRMDKIREASDSDNWL